VAVASVRTKNFVSWSEVSTDTNRDSFLTNSKVTWATNFAGGDHIAKSFLNATN
jgi:hypothetical protein